VIWSSGKFFSRPSSRQKTDPPNVTQMGIRFPTKAVELKMAGAEIQVQLAVAQSLRILNCRILGYFLVLRESSEGEEPASVTQRT